MRSGFMAMARGMFSRILTAAVLVAAETAVAMTFVVFAAAPAGAQLFDDRFPFQNRRQQQRGPFDWFGQPQPQPQYQPREREREREEAAPDYSRAPAAKKADAKSEAAVQ